MIITIIPQSVIISSDSAAKLWVLVYFFCLCVCDCSAETRSKMAETPGPTWTEQLCRRWAVRYRSRKHPVTVTSSPQVRRQLISQFNVCRSRDVATVDRLTAALLCWYLSRVDSLHGLMLTVAVSSHLRLALAVLVVSAAMLVLTGCVVGIVRLVWSMLTVLVYSLLHFTLLLAAMLAGTLATLTLLASFHATL